MSPITNSTSPGFSWWKPAAWLQVSGPDAATFLQGQFTNDLGRLASGTAVYGLWLNLKGRVLADSFVIRGTTADEFWIGSYFSPAAIIRERLESHIIADDVTVVDQTAAWAGVTVYGVGAVDSPAGAAVSGFTFRGRRAADVTAERIFPVDAEPAVLATLRGLTELDSRDVSFRRISAGIPAVPIDIGPGDLPNEAGLESDAISYTKGCYLGQEVMARLKSMGQVRRRLLRIRGIGAMPAKLPAPLFVGPRQVGELRSAVEAGDDSFIGLAMVSLLHVTREAKLGFAPDAAPAVQLLDAP